MSTVVSADSKQLHDTQRHGVIPRLRKSAQHTGHLYQGVARWPVTLTRPWPGHSSLGRVDEDSPTQTQGTLTHSQPQLTVMEPYTAVQTSTGF
jgi:hypothetical protein